jgi:O-antigen/teichoic acid export membrane protein
MASTAFIFLLLSRLLGAEEAGVYYIARRYQLIFGVIALWGLDELMIREISPDHRLTKKYFINFLFLRILTGGISYILLFGTLTLMDYPTDKVLFISILTVSIIPDGINSLFYSLFISREEFIFPTIHAISLAILRIIGIFLLLQSTKLFINVAFLILFSAIFGIFLNLLMISFCFGKRHLSLKIQIIQIITIIIDNIEKNFLWREFKRSIPFALMRIFFVLGSQGDVLIMSIYLPDFEIGYFGAANTVATFFLLLLYGFIDAIFPRMSVLFVNNSEEFWKFTQKSIYIIRVIFLPLTLLVVFFAKPIILIIFGNEFSPAIFLLHWLLWGIVIQFFDAPYSTTMKTSNNQVKLTIILGISMSVNLISNIILIPIIGIYGVVISKIISITFVYFLNTMLITFLVNKTGWKQLLGNLFLSLFVLGSSYFSFKDEKMLANFLLILLIYYGTLFITKNIKFQSFSIISNR